MTNNTIQRELLLPQPQQQVWDAIANSAALEDWMYPNDFEPRVGHPFTFQIPPKPEIGFEGLTVRCEVLECEPPSWLVFSWSVAGPVENTQVTFRLQPEGNGTRLFFEHAGFDLTQPGGKQAFGGAQYGWGMMLEKLTAVLSNQGNHENQP